MSSFPPQSDDDIVFTVSDAQRDVATVPTRKAHGRLAAGTFATLAFDAEERRLLYAAEPRSPKPKGW